MKRLSLALLGLGILAACGGGEVTEEEGPAEEAPAPVLETGGPQANTNVTANIDWAAARDDLTGASDGSQNFAQAQSATTDAPPVPVLLPTGIATVQSATGAAPTYRPVSDGYFATYPGAVYDIVVNGTNQVATIDGEPTAERGVPVFTATVAGAQVALSRYGADYLIEFECHALNPSTGSCIEEDEALRVAESLVVARSR